MNDWPSAALGEIFKIARGGSPRPIDDFYTEEPDGINWIMIGDSSNYSKYISSTKRRIKHSGVARSRTVKPGDFLLTNSMSFGRPYILQTHGCIHDGWLVLSPQTKEVCPDYFYYLLSSDILYREFSRLAAGATVKNLNIDLVSGITVKLPPLHEQRRIAAILDQADALRAKRRAALVHLDKIAQAIFVEMFGSVDHDHPRFTKVKIGDVARVVRGASPRPKGDVRYFGGSIPWVMISDITRQAGRTLNVVHETVTEAGKDKSVYLKEGTLILTNSATVGIPKVLGLDVCIHDGFLGFLDLHKEIRRDYLYHLFLLRRDELVSLAPEGTQKNLNKSIVENFEILLPTLSLQDIFLKRLGATEKIIDSQRVAGREMDSLFASLQHRAFTGAL